MSFDCEVLFGKVSAELKETAEKRFKCLNEAKETLLNTVTRKEHDQDIGW